MMLLAARKNLRMGYMGHMRVNHLNADWKLPPIKTSFTKYPVFLLHQTFNAFLPNKLPHCSVTWPLLLKHISTLLARFM